MKRSSIVKLISGVFSVLAVVSCAGDGEQGSTRGDAVLLGGAGSGSATPGGRMANNAWIPGDEIGVFMLSAGGTIPADILSPEGAAADNRKYISNGTGFVPASEGDKLYYPHDGSAVDFVAYYPYKSSGPGGVENGRVAVDLTDQSDPSKIDLLIGFADGVSKSRDAVPLVFEHRLSKLRLSVVKGAGMETADLTQMTVTFKNAAVVANAGLTRTAVCHDVTYGDIAPYVAAAGEVYEFIVAPNVSVQGRSIEFLVEGEPFVWDIDEATGFDAGHIHSWTVTITRTGVEMTAAEIIPWDDTAPASGGDASQDYALLIPDAGFRAYCLSEFDGDGDGRLSRAEVEGVTEIYVSSSGISSLEGIKYFTNLQLLECYDNSLTSLDVSGLASLQELDCEGNSLTSLDVSGLPSLQYLYCAENSLAELNVSGLASLQRLDCSGNSLAELNVSGLPNLQELDCVGNSLTSLDVTGLANLQTLDCQYNSLASLDVTGLANLQTLDCQYNSLASLDVSGLPNLQALHCSSNSLTSLDVTGLANLQTLDCQYNSLASLDVSGLPNLRSLSCERNPISTLEIFSCPLLNMLFCGNNSTPLTVWTAPTQIPGSTINVSSYGNSWGPIIDKDVWVNNVIVRDKE